MQNYQQAFIQLAIEKGVLKFGEFTLKSHRVSPYFFNTGLFDTGESMVQFSQYFAQSIAESGIEFDVLFGPAYKGITLSCATAMSLSTLTKKEIPYAFNRKEVKDHGEGGSMVGAPLRGKVAIIDDVITAGTAIGESIELIRQAGAEPCAIFLALDRQEKATGLAMSAIQKVQSKFKIPVVTIISLQQLMEYVGATQPNLLQKMQAYRDQYGIAIK